MTSKEWRESVKTIPIADDLSEEEIIQDLEAAEHRAEELKKDMERAYSMLTAGGVTRERARSVANGIAVYQTRMTREVEALEAECGRLRERLQEAATSLETISELAGRDEMLEDMMQVRGYANSRASVAFAALAPQTGGLEQTPPEAQGQEEERHD